MNVVLIVFDSLRRDHVGAFGNDWIRTPHLDAFAREAVRYTQSYPEALPTLPFRRGIHTGERVFPYHNHRSVQKGETVNIPPGWGPMEEEQDTLAELFSAAGYRTALFSDLYHMFKPSKNFHRGFDEWRWIRGQETDRYASGPAVPLETVRAHLSEKQVGDPWVERFVATYLRNNAHRHTEQDYFPARLFREAARWLDENSDAERFFLVVDSFDPHEPWDPPEHYRRLYDPDDDCRNPIQSPYRPWREKLTERELKRIRANYAGEVTLVDRWFGHFMESLRASGRDDETLVVLTSDHGHNLAYPGDRDLVSKQGWPMTKAVCSLMTMIRHPSGEGAGTESDALIQNTDLAATMLAQAGVAPRRPLHGRTVWRAEGRDHVTIGSWGTNITVIDREWWYNASIWGEKPLLYRHREDELLERDLAANAPDVCERLRALAVEDAGGSIPKSFDEFRKLPWCAPEGV